MVFGPTQILRFARIASRTSASQTKSTGFGAGADGAGAASGRDGHSAPSQL